VPHSGLVKEGLGRGLEVEIPLSPNESALSLVLTGVYVVLVLRFTLACQSCLSHSFTARSRNANRRHNENMSHVLQHPRLSVGSYPYLSYRAVLLVASKRACKNMFRAPAVPCSLSFVIFLSFFYKSERVSVAAYSIINSASSRQRRQGTLLCAHHGAPFLAMCSLV
jgi:hypothetical protein